MIERSTAAPAARPAWRPDRIPFWKMNGSGNDFVMIDNRNAIVPAAEEWCFTRAVCDRRRSVGADGVVFIEHPGESDDAIPIGFTWRYRNADGSEGEFCGNGAMCAARMAALMGITGTRGIFSTPAGVIFATVADAPDDPRVAIALSDPTPVSPEARITVAGQPIAVHATTVGVPHAVTVVAAIDEPFPDHGPGVGTLVAVGRAVRRHAHFAPAGTNLDAIQVRPDGTVIMRTYERGVEDETLACGSGAVASALVATALERAASPVTVITRNGSSLIITFDWDAAGTQATNVSLSGQAAVIAIGELTPEALDR